MFWEVHSHHLPPNSGLQHAVKRSFFPPTPAGTFFGLVILDIHILAIVVPFKFAWSSPQNTNLIHVWTPLCANVELDVAGATDGSVPRKVYIEYIVFVFA